MSKIYKQQKIQKLFLPLLKEKGILHQKNKNVFARKGINGEEIVTITRSGIETINTVKDTTSFVVKNQTSAAEIYIVSGPNFKKRYSYLRAASDGFSEYQSQGKVIAIKVNKELWRQLGFSSTFVQYKTPWGREGILKMHDYMVCPLDYSEVYRIGRWEFWETYVPM